MAKVTYIEHGGNEITVDVVDGESVMRGAISNNVRGIDADCGGDCCCATCQVIVADEWMPVVGLPEGLEKSMLQLNPESASNSRLSCQIIVTAELDGLIVEVPEYQM